jgi:hypothetical protein
MVEDFKELTRRDNSRHWVAGLILIGLGTVFLLERLGVVESNAIRQYWPGIIAIVGAGQLLAARDAAQAAKGAFLIFLACWLYVSIQRLWGLSFQNSWPMILIAVGLTHIVGGLSAKSEKRTEESPS